MRLDKPEYGKDVAHDSCAHVLAQQKKFSQWLESENPEVYANAMLILLSRTINMLLRQLEAQGDNFAQEGGFREKLTAVRTEARAKQEDTPVCPECGRPMRRRRAKSRHERGPRILGVYRLSGLHGDQRGLKRQGGEHSNPRPAAFMNAPGMCQIHAHILAPLTPWPQAEAPAP